MAHLYPRGVVASAGGDVKLRKTPTNEHGVSNYVDSPGAVLGHGDTVAILQDDVLPVSHPGGAIVPPVDRFCKVLTPSGVEGYVKKKYISVVSPEPVAASVVPHVPAVVDSVVAKPPAAAVLVNSVVAKPAAPVRRAHNDCFIALFPPSPYLFLY